MDTHSTANETLFFNYGLNKSTLELHYTSKQTYNHYKEAMIGGFRTADFTNYLYLMCFVERTAVFMAQGKKVHDLQNTIDLFLDNGGKLTRYATPYILDSIHKNKADGLNNKRDTTHTENILKWYAYNIVCTLLSQPQQTPSNLDMLYCYYPIHLTNSTDIKAALNNKKNNTIRCRLKRLYLWGSQNKPKALKAALTSRTVKYDPNVKGESLYNQKAITYISYIWDTNHSNITPIINACINNGKVYSLYDADYISTALNLWQDNFISCLYMSATNYDLKIYEYKELRIKHLRLCHEYLKQNALFTHRTE